MEAHVNHVRKTCYAQLRMIGRLRTCLTSTTTHSLVRNLVLTRLDYCNAVLIDIPEFLIHKLQVLQNNAARLVFRLRRYDHASPALISLHWLPVAMRPKYKVCVLVFQCLSGSGPEYLASLLEIQESRLSLRSAQDNLLLVVPRTS